MKQHSDSSVPIVLLAAWTSSSPRSIPLYIRWLSMKFSGERHSISLRSWSSRPQSLFLSFSTTPSYNGKDAFDQWRIANNSPRSLLRSLSTKFNASGVLSSWKQQYESGLHLDPVEVLHSTLANASLGMRIQETLAHSILSLRVRYSNYQYQSTMC